MNANTLLEPVTNVSTGSFVLVFRTNIRYKKDIKTLAAVLDDHPFISKWNVDLDDDEKILRIVSLENCANEYILLVKNAGYSCEELND
jgi:hypothetical protein